MFVQNLSFWYHKFKRALTNEWFWHHMLNPYQNSPPVLAIIFCHQYLPFIQGPVPICSPLIYLPSRKVGSKISISISDHSNEIKLEKKIWTVYYSCSIQEVGGLAFHFLWPRPCWLPSPPFKLPGTLYWPLVASFLYPACQMASILWK